MLYQLHWQSKDGTTEMRVQRDINSDSEMKKFIKEAQENHPLPNEVSWMICNEKSKHFVFMDLR